jgi:hypothetical protein
LRRFSGGSSADRDKPGMKGTFAIGPCTHDEEVTGGGRALRRPAQRLAPTRLGG